MTYNKSILEVVLASMESVLDGCSDANPSDVVLPKISYNELVKAYELLKEEQYRIIEMPIDRDDMSHFVEYVGGLVVADAESMYDSTTYPGEVSDQLEREEAMANYTVMTEVLGKLIVDLELEVDSDVLSSDCLDAAIDNEQE